MHAVIHWAGTSAVVAQVLPYKAMARHVQVLQVFFYAINWVFPILN